MNKRSTDPAGNPAARIVEIELLALDLTTCTRCVGTLENIGKAIVAAGTVAGSGDVPENLHRFFAGGNAAAVPESAACCPPAEQETCCDPLEKAGCCASAAPAACGCR